MERTRSRSPQSQTASSSPASTTVTTPDQSPGADEDIWDTSSDHGHGDGHGQPHHAISDTTTQGQPSATRPQQILSDLPQLRRQHMTDGYREGLSVGKAAVMQDGFDSGYPLGVEIGLRVGAVFGVLEGVLEGLKKTSSEMERSGTSRQSGPGLRGPAALLRGENASRGANAGAGAGASASTPLSGRGGPTPNNSNHTTNLEGLVGVNNDENVFAGGMVAGNTSPSVSRAEESPDVKAVEKLYEEAKTELKISELMKNLDDSMIDRMGRLSVDVDVDVDVDTNGDDDKATAREMRGLPQEIEQVISRWEDVVLKSLAARL